MQLPKSQGQIFAQKMSLSSRLQKHAPIAIPQHAFLLSSRNRYSRQSRYVAHVPR